MVTTGNERYGVNLQVAGGKIIYGAILHQRNIFVISCCEDAKGFKTCFENFYDPPPPKRAVDPPPAPGHMKGGLPDRKGLITNFIEIKLPVLSPFIHHSEK